MTAGLPEKRTGTLVRTSQNVATLQHPPPNYVDSVTERVPGNIYLGT